MRKNNKYSERLCTTEGELRCLCGGNGYTR